MQASLPLMAAVLLLLAPAAAGETVPVGCQSDLWGNLPLAQQHTPAEHYDPSSYAYYKEWTLKHILPPAIFAAAAAILLAAFLLWRLVKLATCARCIRGPRHRSKAAIELLSARSMLWLKLGVATLACGVVGGAGFGFSTIQPQLEPRGVAVFQQAKEYVTSGLATANNTVAAVDGVETYLLYIRQRVVDLGLEERQPGIVQTIDAFQQQIADGTANLQASIDDLQAGVLGEMDRHQDRWQPTLDKLDIVKDSLLYACYVLIIASAVVVALATCLNCPGAVKATLPMLLLLILLAWAAVTAATTGMKVGSDGCSAAEDKIMSALIKAAGEQVKTGNGVLATVGIGNTIGLGRYYLYNTGKNATEVLQDLTGLDIQGLIRAANVTVASLQQASSALADRQPAASTLPGNLDVLAGLIGGVSGNISALEAAISFERFHPVYMSVKSYACCDLLNFLSGLWLGLLIVGCCGLPLTLAVFVWLGRMDQLEPRGCCHVYRRSDYSQLQETGVPAVPELPQHAQQQLPGGDGDKKEQGRPSSRLVPPLQLTAESFSQSLRQKFAAGRSVGTWPRAGSTSPPGGCADTFRIRTAEYGSSSTPGPDAGGTAAAAGCCESEPGTSRPSAPALPLSSRSLHCARNGGASSAALLPAAVAAGSAPASARGSRSMPGSASSSACGGGSSSATAALLPAAVAASLLSSPPPPPAAQGSSAAQEQQQAADATGGGSSAAGGSSQQKKSGSSKLARLFGRR